MWASDESARSRTGDAQGDVEPAADEIDHLVAEIHFQRHVGIAAHELGQDRRQVNDAERHRHGQAHRAPGRIGLRLDFSLHGLSLVEDPCGSIDGHAAAFRQRHLA